MHDCSRGNEGRCGNHCRYATSTTPIQDEIRERGYPKRLERMAHNQTTEKSDLSNRPFAQIVVSHDFELFTCVLDHLRNKR